MLLNLAVLNFMPKRAGAPTSVIACVANCVRSICLQAKVASLKEQLLERRQHIASMMEKTSEVKRMKEELRYALSQVCFSSVTFFAIFMRV